MTCGGVGAVAAAVVVLLAMPPEGPWPPVGVGLTVVLGLAALTTVLIAINHAVRSLSVSQVVRDLAERALAQISELPQEGNGDHDDLPELDGTRQWTVRSTRMGWLVGLDHKRLLGAIPPDTVAEVYPSPGAFVAPGDTLLMVDTALKETHVGLEDAFELAARRDPDTTIELAVDQLVDIVRHAMMTNHADTLTAHEGLEHVVVILESLMGRDPADRVHTGENGRRVVLPPRPTAADGIARTFRRLRHAAASNIATAQEALDAMGRLHAAADRHGARAVTRAIEAESASLLEVIRHENRVPPRDLAELRALASHLGVHEQAGDRTDDP